LELGLLDERGKVRDHGVVILLLHIPPPQVEKLQVRLDKSYAEKDKLEAKLEYSQSELGKLKAELDKTSSDQNFRCNDYNDGRQKITKLELEIERLRQENDRCCANEPNVKNCR
jgi:chromosome segregation ATPase